MRNTFLIAKREYLERVRRRSFLLSTLVLPLFMYGVIVLPSRLATMKLGGERHIVVVTSNTGFFEAVKSELTTVTSEPTETKEPTPSRNSKYNVEIEPNTTEAERNVLRAKLTSGEIDGFLWATDDAVAANKIVYAARETSDFVENTRLGRAIRQAKIRQALAGHGVSPGEIDALFTTVELDVITVKAGGDTKVKGGPMAFLGAFVPVLLLYMTILLYAIAVMRAVLEEKTSRVMEVLLSSVTAQELMGGKILGVGAVGLTQVAIWAAACIPFLLPAAGAGVFGGFQVSPLTLLAFGVFYLLGYLLYSTMYAALGAAVNSEQEAQQWQSVIMMPMIVSIVLMMYMIQHPNSPLAFWGSLIPLFAPILMYVRIVVQTPPLWQIGLSIALLLAMIYGMVVLCGRIYRIGILMYGKRATLPEIMKWIKYA